MKTIQRLQSEEQAGRYQVLVLLDAGEAAPAAGDVVNLDTLGPSTVLDSQPNTYQIPGVEPHHEVVILVAMPTDGRTVADQSYDMSVLTAEGAPTVPPVPTAAGDPSDAIQDLTWTGLEHGVESVRGGGPLVPFVMVDVAGERKLQRFMAGSPDGWDLGESVEQAVAFTRSTIPTAERLVLVYDGYIRNENDRVDAIFAEGYEAGALAFGLAQQYRPKGRFRGFETIGNAKRMPPDMSRLRQ